MCNISYLSQKKLPMKNIIPTLLLVFIFTLSGFSQHSVARLWNEQVLSSIRSDYSRPTVHARNLFHTSVAMYDAWAIYEPNADTYFLGKTNHGFDCHVGVIHPPVNVKEAQETAMSYAMYRLIHHRFRNAPEVDLIYERINLVMDSLGLDTTYTSTDFSCSPAAMGNYIAAQLIEYGKQDGSNEINDYANQTYTPVNPAMSVRSLGTNIEDINRWQPLTFFRETRGDSVVVNGFVWQSGFVGTVAGPLTTTVETPEFLSPEWGDVLPFAMQDDDKTRHYHSPKDLYVYHDPGLPPLMDMENFEGTSDEFRWGHTLVARWSAHLDAEDGVMWDISPASIGNLTDYPTDIIGLRDFYNEMGGGDNGPGHAINPITNAPYQPQIVPRGDYTRVLAEFWADGPDSETPPGHWYSILNSVSDHPLFEKRFKGEGEILEDLEWDVKSYFILGGAMHDAAVAAWNIKGYYDYVRPISAIRAMAQYGQSSYSDIFNLFNYHRAGLKLEDDFCETISSTDPMRSEEGVEIYDLKLKAWKGNKHIGNPDEDVAGVGWIPASQWEPYQRPSFVTPPFAGYVSGHSTFSRAAAEVMTMLTGDPFFPGGMGRFICKKDEFLVFEQGPSVDVELQWATYRDASDQCSLSRIWGGIHPPADDIPGRLIGIKIGTDAFRLAEQYFYKEEPIVEAPEIHIFPNPSSCTFFLELDYEGGMDISVYTIDGKFMKQQVITFNNKRSYISLENIQAGVYVLLGKDEMGEQRFEQKVIVQ